MIIKQRAPSRRIMHEDIKCFFREKCADGWKGGVQIGEKEGSQRKKKRIGDNPPIYDWSGGGWSSFYPRWEIITGRNQY